MLTLKFMVSGRVQGVFFRAHTKEEALKLELTGWVMNTDNGKVEGEAYGEHDKLLLLAKWLSTGSPAAEVQDLNLSWEKEAPEQRPQMFEIR